MLSYFYLSLDWLYMHSPNEEMGRHREREDKMKSALCGNECDSVSHVLRECSALLLYWY